MNIFYKLFYGGKQNGRTENWNSEKEAGNYIINLQQENARLKEVIEELREYIEDWLFDAGGNGASMTYEDINELLQILDKVKD